MIAFADTFYFLAFLSGRDAAHAAAGDYWSDRAIRLVTSEWVLLELADGMSYARHRSILHPFVRTLRANRRCSIIAASKRTLEQAWKLHADRADKDWTLTDCTSFVLMRERRLTDVLTADHHFEQAGFRALLRNP